MAIGRVVGILVAILVVFWILSAPVTAAGTVNTILADLADAGTNLISFFRHVVG